MGLDQHNKIDIVSLDKSGGTVVLSMVETRPWGQHGELLPDLQAKLNTYLSYTLDGQLPKDYPDVAHKRVTFRLHFAYVPGPQEELFLQLLRERYLEPNRIGWEQGLLPGQ